MRQRAAWVVAGLLATYPIAAHSEESAAATESRGLNWQGGRLEAAGKNDEAADAFERALAITEELRGADHPDVAILVADVADIAMRRRDFTAARAATVRIIRWLPTFLPHLACSVSMRGV